VGLARPTLGLAKPKHGRRGPVQASSGEPRSSLSSAGVDLENGSSGEPQFSLSSAGVGLENGVGLMGLMGVARPRHGRRGPVRANFGEQYHGSSASSPSLFHDFLSLLPKIRPPSITSGGKLKKPTKSSLKNQFLMSKIRF
jgi:hypothetical protein